MFFLLMAYSQEEQDKFCTIYQQHCDYLLRYARYLMKSSGDAESAVHDTFIRALKNLYKISDTECSKTRCFLVRTLERVVFTMLKKDPIGKFEEYDETYHSQQLNDKDPVWNIMDITNIRCITKQLLENLPERDRNLLIYQIVDEMTYDQIAQETGMTVSNVSVRLTRIRKKLREDFAERREGGQ